MVARIEGRRAWRLRQDDKGHREYQLRTLVISDNTENGPFTIFRTPGLPAVGSSWIFGTDNDPEAICRRNADIQYIEGMKDGEACLYWIVDQIFSTAPLDDCDEDETYPILMKPKVSGGFSKYSEEARTDRFDKDILNSAFEFVRGPQNEWDANRPTVRVESNESILRWDLLCEYMDGVNQDVMWDKPARTIKLSACTWEQRFYGPLGTGTGSHIVCNVYYKRTLEFEHRKEGFDRAILDEGTKCLKGTWQGISPGSGLPKKQKWVLDADIINNPNAHLVPSYFQRFVDAHMNPTRVLLNGFGLPLDIAGDPVHIPSQSPSGKTEKYTGHDFYLLGNLPISIGEGVP